MIMTVGKIWWFFAFLTLLGLLACGSQSEQQATSSVTQPKLIPQSTPLVVSLEDLELATGQTIFVPAYIGIHFTAKSTINLTTTISIHNTDLQESIIINSIQHYGGNGKLIKDYVQTPVRLAPMATTMFYVERGEPQEGLGANFIIKWVAEKETHEPVVEAVMIGSVGNHGVSFISPGRVLSQK
jgi:hypothetical protein